MSVFCPKCGKQTYNEYICDHCDHQIKKEKIIHPNWKPTKTTISSIDKNKKISINTIIGIIIAIAIGYIAYTKYEERRMMEKFIGTTDPEELHEQYIKQIKSLEKITNEEIRKMNQKNKETLKKIKQLNNFRDRTKSE
jgi:ribosomal protein L37E